MGTEKAMNTRGDSRWDGSGVPWPVVLALALAGGLGLGMPVTADLADLKPLLIAVLCLTIGALSDTPWRAWLGGLLLAVGHLLMCRLQGEPCQPWLTVMAGAVAYGPVAATVNVLLNRSEEALPSAHGYA